MQRHGLGSATLDDVLTALLDGAQATLSTGKLKSATLDDVLTALLAALTGTQATISTGKPEETTGNSSIHSLHLHAHHPAQ